jgi:hypothetical protein
MFSKTIPLLGIAVLLLAACGPALKKPPDLEPYFFQPGELGSLAVSPVTRTISADGIAYYYQTIASNSEKKYGSISVAVNVKVTGGFYIYNDREDTPIPNLGDQDAFYRPSYEYNPFSYRTDDGSIAWFWRCGAHISVSLVNDNYANDWAIKLDAKMKDVLCRYQYPAGTPTPR